MEAKQAPIEAFIQICVDCRHDGGVLHVNKADALRNAHDMATIFGGGRLRHGNTLHVGGVRVKFNWTGGRLFGNKYSDVFGDEFHLDRIAMHARQIGTEQRLINAIEQAGKR